MAHTVRVTVAVTRTTYYDIDVETDDSAQPDDILAQGAMCFADGDLEERACNDWDEGTETDRVCVSAQISGEVHELEF